MGDLEQFLLVRQEQIGIRPEGRRKGLAHLRAEIQEKLASSQDLKGLRQEEAGPLVQERAWSMLRQALETEHRHLILSAEEKQDAVRRIRASMFGLGPLQELVNDPSVTEVMVNGPSSIFVERRLEGHRARVMRATDRFGAPIEFTGDKELLNTIERIVASINRKVDESSPIADARLKENGARVNIVLHPISLDGHAITIRTFPEPITMDKLVQIGSLPDWLADLLRDMVKARYNLVVSGGTGSGKTTFLNALSQFIEADERVVTVEDAAELQLRQIPNIVRLESRPANLEGKGAIPIRELVRTSLRMRPDRIVVGEVRGGEALDMLQAMNTGHDGSMTTAHANNTRDLTSRLETMVLMSGVELPLPAVRRQISAAVDFIIQLSRLPDRSRKVVQLTEVLGMEDGEIILRDLLLRNSAGELAVKNQIARPEKFRMAGLTVDCPVLQMEEVTEG